MEFPVTEISNTHKKKILELVFRGFSGRNRPGEGDGKKKKDEIREVKCHFAVPLTLPSCSCFDDRFFLKKSFSIFTHISTKYRLLKKYGPEKLVHKKKISQKVHDCSGPFSKDDT